MLQTRDIAMKRNLKIYALRTRARLVHQKVNLAQQVRANLTTDVQQWCYHLAVVIVGGYSVGNLLSDIWHWERVVFPIT
jgi:hypothetical protein